MSEGREHHQAEPAILIRGLRKSYGDLEALKGIDLEVEEGEVFALLGPNGAGKTTTVEILEGFRKRDAGEVLVLGQDPEKDSAHLSSKTGIVLQSTGMDPYLSVAETLDMFGGYYPHPRPVDEVIELVGLEEKRDARVTKLSGGQKRRLDLAIALVGDPELLFLDEPTTGFDPGARRQAWEVVRNLATLGKTIFLTTHYMDEAQNLAGRVAIIAAGKILVEGPPATLAGRDLSKTLIRFKLARDAALPEPVQAAARHADGCLELYVSDPLPLLHELTGWALRHHIQLERLEVTRPTLEDVYLELTGNAAGEDPVQG